MTQFKSHVHQNEDEIKDASIINSGVLSHSFVTEFEHETF